MLLVTTQKTFLQKGGTQTGQVRTVKGAEISGRRLFVLTLTYPVALENGPLAKELLRQEDMHAIPLDQKTLIFFVVLLPESPKLAN